MIVLLLAVLAAEAPAEPRHVHEPTGLVFAPRVYHLRCTNVRVMDEKHNAVSLAYKSPRGFTATVFVYPKLPPHSFPSETFAAHLETVRDTVARNHNDLKCEPWTARDRPAMSGLRCTGKSEDMIPVLTYIASKRSMAGG